MRSIFPQVTSKSGTAQQSVHPTLGILARFQAFFYASAFFQSDGVPPPAPARVTQTVGQPFLLHQFRAINCNTFFKEISTCPMRKFDYSLQQLLYSQAASLPTQIISM
jgi:hypothetical protein